MADPVFYSKLGPSLITFIAQKRASGYPYNTSARILGYLDNMIIEQFPDSEVFSKEVCDAWIEQCSKYHPNTLFRRVTPVRQFAKYVVGTGKYAYIIPGNVPSKQIRYDAHIFTEIELVAYFASIDKCQKSPFAPVRCYVIPVFFRLLFSCGLRSTETRLLLTEDVDLETGKIFIRKSKGWEARIIYISNDLLELLIRYDAIIKKVFPERESFFPNMNGTYYSKSTPDVWFHEFWDQLPEATITKGNPPRVHDFRHTFCVYRLNQWVLENKDINALYPYLSEFMGHSNFADTDYYLTLAESFYPELQKRMHSVNARVLPEVLYES